MSVFNMLIYGLIAVGAVCVTDGLTIDGKCTLVYLAMILGVLMSIAKVLEKSVD